MGGTRQEPEVNRCALLHGTEMTGQDPLRASPRAPLVKKPPATRETWVRSLGWEDPPGEGKGYPLQYSGLEKSMDYMFHGSIGHKELDMTEQLSLSKFYCTAQETPLDIL